MVGPVFPEESQGKLLVELVEASRSAAAVVLGFERFDPHLMLAGVVFNRASGPAHRQWLTDAVASAGMAPPLKSSPDSGLALALSNPFEQH